MVRFLIIFILFIANIYSQWFAQNPGINNTFKSVHFVNENTGFIAGFNTVLKTTNSGAAWSSTILTGIHNSIFFVNSNTGFVCGDNGKIFKTTNAGVSWNELTSGSANNLMRITFLNETTGIAVGFKRTILKTTDSGLNWTSLISNLDTINFLGCRFISENNYIVTGTSSTIYLSANSGASWNSSSLGYVNPLWAPEFINENTGWITGCCGIFIKTTNAGLSWTPDIYLTIGNTVYTMDFVNDTTGFLCGDGGILYRTTSGGNSWDSTVTGTNQILYSVFMINQNTGWVVGNYGTILKTTNGGGTGFPIGVNVISTVIPENFRLYQNYPNPFNPETIIKFDINKQSNVKLILYDILGNEIAIMIDNNLKAGSYSYSLNLSGFSSGVYFYKILTGNNYDVKKLIFIK